MTIYKVQVTVHDGENEYPMYEYVSATSPEKAASEVVKLYGFNRKKNNFRKVEDNKWEERKGWRLYELEPDVEPATIPVLGMSGTFRLSELAGRPVLPLDSLKADWVWKRGGQREYWFFMGEYVVRATLSTIEPLFFIDAFPYWNLNRQAAAQHGDKWTLIKGDIDEEA